MLVIDGARLRREREARALSRADLAAKTDLSDRTIERIELGRNAKPSTIRRLAKALELKPLDLAHMTDGGDA